MTDNETNTVMFVYNSIYDDYKKAKRKRDTHKILRIKMYEEHLKTFQGIITNELGLNVTFKKVGE